MRVRKSSLSEREANKRDLTEGDFLNQERSSGIVTWTLPSSLPMPVKLLTACQLYILMAAWACMVRVTGGHDKPDIAEKLRKRITSSTV
ncbi:unnamed protein product [Euphydryas editha]|uniref:Uncharacterized protein n=1 Tax=Euphydryas editha TaxID=104508 RepID=A0AAU9UTD0_EUPED|nr:unnamed protein product [Euphydryas editha]